MFPMTMVIVVAALLAFVTLIPHQNIDTDAPLDPKNHQLSDVILESRYQQLNSLHSIAVAYAQHQLSAECTNNCWTIYNQAYQIGMANGLFNLNGASVAGDIYIPPTLNNNQVLDDTVYAARYVWVQAGGNPQQGSGYIITYPAPGSLTPVEIERLSEVAMRATQSMVGVAKVQADGTILSTSAFRDRNDGAGATFEVHRTQLPFGDATVPVGTPVRFGQVYSCQRGIGC